MRADMVPVPVSLLLEPTLTAAAKVLWLALRAQQGSVLVSELAVRSGLTRPTVRRSLAQLEVGLRTALG